jgi:hypothetical protein
MLIWLKVNLPYTKWKKNKEETYLDSLMHFVRSLLYKDGFPGAVFKKSG